MHTVILLTLIVTSCIISVVSFFLLISQRSKIGDLSRRIDLLQSQSKNSTLRAEDDLNGRLIDLQRMKFSQYPLRKRLDQ